jgi:hypothetical protein
VGKASAAKTSISAVKDGDWMLQKVKHEHEHTGSRCRIPAPAQLLCRAVDCCIHRLWPCHEHACSSWVLRSVELIQADAIKGFLAQQRGRTHQSVSKTAWLVAWEQLAAEG